MILNFPFVFVEKGYQVKHMPLFVVPRAHKSKSCFSSISCFLGERFKSLRTGTFTYFWTSTYTRTFFEGSIFIVGYKDFNLILLLVL